MVIESLQPQSGHITALQTVVMLVLLCFCYLSNIGGVLYIDAENIQYKPECFELSQYNC